MQSETLVEEFSRLVREYKQDDGPGGIEDWNLIADFAVDNAEAIEAALSAAEPQPAPSVAVKALEWIGDGTGDVMAKTFYGNYYVWESEGKAWMTIPLNFSTPHYPSTEEAKAAAQADYEARIRSALSAQVQDVAMVTRESAIRAIGHIDANNGRGRKQEAISLLAAAPAKQEG